LEKLSTLIHHKQQDGHQHNVVDNIVAMEFVAGIDFVVILHVVQIVARVHVVDQIVVDHHVVVHFHLIIDKQTTLYVHKQTNKQTHLILCDLF
jgi:hypothetical protein